MKSILTFIILLSGLQKAMAQQMADTIKAGTAYWALHAAAGIQSSAYFEAGVSRVYYDDRKFGASALWTVDLEGSPNLHASGQGPIWGIKAGLAGFASLFGIGADLKYLSDFSNSTVILTPKAGIGLYGTANLFIGYNIMDTRSPFRSIGPWQLSLDVNYSRRFLKDMGW